MRVQTEPRPALLASASLPARAPGCCQLPELMALQAQCVRARDSCCPPRVKEARTVGEERTTQSPSVS
jgi:hypothetical protein